MKLLAPLIAAPLVAIAMRLAGARLRRPVPRFIAGTAGLLAGWSMLQPRTLPALALGALLAAGLALRDPAKARKGAPAPPPEAKLWLVLVALCGGVWIGGARPLPSIVAAACILAAGLLADDAWRIAAAAASLAGALAAIGAPWSVALVVLGACTGLGALLPLSAGLGAAAALAASHRGTAYIAAALAPFACLLLMRWWRHRFIRFGRGANAARAITATGIVVALAFSAAAMARLR